jgi:hypothetical protein
LSTLPFCNSRDKTLEVLSTNVVMASFRFNVAGCGPVADLVRFAPASIRKIVRVPGYPQKWTCMFAVSHNVARLGTQDCSNRERRSIFPGITRNPPAI